MSGNEELGVYELREATYCPHGLDFAFGIEGS